MYSVLFLYQKPVDKWMDEHWALLV